MLIKFIPSFHILAGLAATVVLVGCASPGAGDHGEHHPPQSESASGSSAAMGGTMGAGMTGSAAGCGMMTDCAAAQGKPMDKDAMCTMYRNMMSAPDDKARQSMMDRQMQGMSPEMRQRHMEMMKQQCQ
jgi:hypothetical protein